MAFPSGWNRRVKLTIDSTKVSADLTDFPVLITKDNIPSEVLDADGSFPAKSDGGDIRITTDEDGTNQIPVEVQQFTIDNDPTNGEAFIWCKVPSVSGSVDTDIWLWYNNPGASLPSRSDTYGSENVWTDFDGVYHLHEGDSVDTDFYKDQTSNLNHGTLVDSDLDVTQITGKIGNALNFLTDADYINLGTGTYGKGAAESFTFTVWIRSNASDAGNWFFSTGDGGAGDAWWGVRTNSRKLELFIDDGADTSLLTSINDASDNSWHYVVCVVDRAAQTAEIFIDASSEDSDADISAIGSLNTSDVNRLCDRSAAGDYAGDIDEVRFYSGVLSSNWLSTEFNNQNAPSTFINEGTPETPPSSYWYPKNRTSHNLLLGL